MNKERQSTFKFSDFFKLINQIHPKYWQLIVGILLGFISTGVSLFVPQLAQRLINNFRHISTSLIILTAIIFIGGLLIGALSGLILGIFGEDVVAKMRKTLWSKLLHLPVKYFDNTKTGEISSRLVNDTSQVKNLLANTLPNAVTSPILWSLSDYDGDGLANDFNYVHCSSSSNFSLVANHATIS